MCMRVTSQYFRYVQAVLRVLGVVTSCLLLWWWIDMLLAKRKLNIKELLDWRLFVKPGSIFSPTAKDLTSSGPTVKSRIASLYVSFSLRHTPPF